MVHNLSQFRQVEILVLLGHIPAGDDGRDGGRVGTGPPDPQLFHGLYQGRLRIMGRRLGEMLLALKALPGQFHPLLQSSKEHVLLFLLLIRLGVHRAESFKQDPGSRHSKPVVACRDPHGSSLVSGRLHPAGHKPLPDQLIEPELVSGKRILHLGRCAGHICRPDSLVGVLDVPSVPAPCICRRHKFLSVVLGDVRAHAGVRLLGDPGGVGTQVGDHTHGAVPFDIHAFIELLGDPHGLGRGEVQRLGSLLLQGTGGKGNGHLLGPLALLYFFHTIPGVFQVCQDLLHLFF